MAKVLGLASKDASDAPVPAPSPPSPADDAKAILLKMLVIAPGAMYGSVWLYYTMYQFGGEKNWIWLIVGAIGGAIAPLFFNAMMWSVIVLGGWTISRSPEEMAAAWSSGDKVWNVLLALFGAGIAVSSVVFNLVPTAYQSKSATSPAPSDPVVKM
jgi:hypothetical protein